MSTLAIPVRGIARCRNRRHQSKPLPPPLPGGPALIYLDTYMPCEVYKRMESVFEIIAEPNRRAILSLLVSSQQSVGEIERQLRMPQPTVSKHLRVLREAGFVESTVDAQRRLYRLKPEPLQEVDAWLAQFRRFWSAHVDALERHLDRMDQLAPAKRKTRRRTSDPNRERDKGEPKLKIKLTSVHVDDQDKALALLYGGTGLC